MNDELLRELIAAQKEQTELLRKYLWRFRFSLLSLLCLTTAAAIVLGVLVYAYRSQPVPTSITAGTTGPIPVTGGSGTLIWTTQTVPPTNDDLSPFSN